MPTRACDYCKQPFEAVQSRPRAQRYCSADCYQRARHGQAEEFQKAGKPCAVCGKLMYPNPDRSPSEFDKKRFCSRECRGLNRRNSVEDIAAKIVVNQKTGCHMWTGPQSRDGYGQIGVDRKTLLIHRFIWEQKHGPIPEEMQIHHMCGVKACCNFEHLQLMGTPDHCRLHTGAVSIGAKNARKTECPTCGSPFSFWPNGYRYCKPCLRRWQAEYQRKLRARPGWNEINTARCRKYRAKRKQKSEGDQT